MRRKQAKWRIFFRDDEIWSIDPSVADLDLHMVGMESYSKLSDENLNTILRSYSETLSQKRVHIDLLKKIECENKEELIEQSNEGMETLNHELRCITAELANRKMTKNGREKFGSSPV